MFKKNFFLLCALTAAYAPVAVAAPDCFREDEIVDVTKGKKCCRCCSLTVTNNASIGGNLTVGGSVTASSFILSSGATLVPGLRNYAVFSNITTLTSPGTTVVPFAASSAASISAGISIDGTGVITLPTTGIFLVMYTLRVAATGAIATGTVSAQLQQTRTGAGSEVAISQPAVVDLTDVIATVGLEVQSQISGYAIVTTTSTLNNQIDLQVILPAGYTVPATLVPDANAQLTVLQLN
jgi:hypothetical protein